jgi:hypothetical protein
MNGRCNANTTTPLLIHQFYCTLKLPCGEVNPPSILNFSFIYFLYTYGLLHKFQIVNDNYFIVFQTQTLNPFVLFAALLFIFF